MKYCTLLILITLDQDYFDLILTKMKKCSYKTAFHYDSDFFSFIFRKNTIRRYYEIVIWIIQLELRLNGKKYSKEFCRV